ncbi:MAG: TIGR01440 family protein [Lachnospiraceae bacterium]|nr:TIGR01440 family protein [Lachnospiraceae bacterium]
MMDRIKEITDSKILESIYNDAVAATTELIEKSGLGDGDILVVGCSTSEVTGDTIGSASSVDVAKTLFKGIYEVTSPKGIYIAAQCCEHLNRAIIIEKEVAKRERLQIVNVVPQPKAGGSFATTAYNNFKSPVAVEHIKAQAGMDIGDTLIGMHLEEVAVPLRLNKKKIGEARIVCARTRAKFIGGERAVYDETLL